MHTEIHCATLPNLEPIKAIRAIHQAWLQLRAVDSNCDCEPYDNKPALSALRDCLQAAGHPAGEH